MEVYIQSTFMTLSLGLRRTTFFTKIPCKIGSEWKRMSLVNERHFFSYVCQNDYCSEYEPTSLPGYVYSRIMCNNFNGETNRNKKHRPTAMLLDVLFLS